MFKSKAPRKREVPRRKKEDDDPTMLTAMSSVISESGNVEHVGSFGEGNRVKLPVSKITKAS